MSFSKWLTVKMIWKMLNISWTFWKYDLDDVQLTYKITSTLHTKYCWNTNELTISTTAYCHNIKISKFQIVLMAFQMNNYYLQNTRCSNCFQDDYLEGWISISTGQKWNCVKYWFRIMLILFQRWNQSWLHLACFVRDLTGVMQ